MKFLRRILGIFVMIAGILGLALSLAGLAAVWMVKPTVVGNAQSMVETLSASIDTSQQAMQITSTALGATIDSIDALSAMLGTTAASVEDTKPVLTQLNTIMGETLPSTLESATDSLKTAQQAAEVLDSAIKSLESFTIMMSAVPLVGGFVDLPDQPYNPEVPLADSLGALASDLEGLPDTFTKMSADLAKADDKLNDIQDNLTTMSSSVALISKSLGEYQAMIAQSQTSMDNLKSVLTNVQNNLITILDWTAIGLSLFLGWLLVAQVVILSQGWELYQGTAGRMESGAPSAPAAEPPASE
ncbi:MAG: hypothetical protein AB1894_29455 [Chloroflexota bacterium]